jgi:hypothetical protein
VSNGTGKPESPGPSSKNRATTGATFIGFGTRGAKFWVVVCLGLSALLYFAIPSSGAWIELFNGATWPGDLAKEVQTNHAKRIPFAIVLAARTLLNLSGAVVVVYAIYWFLLGGKANAMQKTLANVRAIRYASLQFHLVAFLREHEGEELNKDLVDKFKARMQDWEASELANRLDTELVEVALDSQLGV